jgi:2,3-bisphosphoglycerate-independent phosphoglycerate mutase
MLYLTNNTPQLAAEYYLFKQLFSNGLAIQVSPYFYGWKISMSPKLIFIFFDGLGLGDKSENNPLLLANMSFLNSMIDGALISGNEVNKEYFLFKAIDASLSVEGIPQSATGQTALFTGINAAQILGCHLSAFPNNKLREIINRQNIIKDTIERGKQAVFANSYSPKYFQLVEEGKRRHSVTTLCVLSAGIPFKRMDDLLAGRAVHWDITRTLLNQQYKLSVPIITPEEAGQHLVSLLDENDLVVYECFIPDYIGHKVDKQQSIYFLELIDRFLGSVWENRPDNATLVVTSDHGNIENLATFFHTMNPVPLLVFGKDKDEFQNVDSIVNIYDSIMKVLFS